MASAVESATRLIPSLVQYCQRVASTHVDSISGLGDDLPYELIKPILESCSLETLARLEEVSPHIQSYTQDLWKKFCSQRYPQAVERFLFDEGEEKALWREQYFIFQDAEAKKLEEVSLKIRSQRLEADDRKREREVKFTDRVPQERRSRGGWSGGSQPKSLFQKTRSEASKIQKTMYQRLLPPMAAGKTFRVLHNPHNAKLLPAPATSEQSCVTVKSVLYRRPASSASNTAANASTSTYTPKSSNSKIVSSQTVDSNRPAKRIRPSDNSAMSRPPHSPNRANSTPAGPLTPTSADTTSPSITKNEMSLESLRPPKPPSPSKKNPMAALFMPKHRAHSQRPTQPALSRSIPSG